MAMSTAGARVVLINEPERISALQSLIRIQAETHVYRKSSELQHDLERIEESGITAQTFKRLLELRDEISWWADSAKACLNNDRDLYRPHTERERENTMMQVCRWLYERADAQVLRYQKAAIDEHASGRGTMLTDFTQILFDHAKESSKHQYWR